MNERDIEDKISEGFIHVKIIIEMIGKPKEHIESTLTEYIDRITKNEYIVIVNKEIFMPKELDEGMFSTFADLELLIKGISRLIGFCFDYMPSSIEIIEPQKMMFSHQTVTTFINDLQGKLHHLDMKLKQGNSENIFLKRNMDKILRNFITIILKSRESSAIDISKMTGIPQKDTQFLLDSLEKEKVIKKGSSGYTL